MTLLLDEESRDSELLRFRQCFRRATHVALHAADWAKKMHYRCLFRKPTVLQYVLALEEEDWVLTPRI